jgi:hypothetical protein
LEDVQPLVDATASSVPAAQTDDAEAATLRPIDSDGAQEDPAPLQDQEIERDPSTQRILRLSYGSVVGPKNNATFEVWSDGNAEFSGWRCKEVAWRGRVDLVRLEKAIVTLRRVNVCGLKRMERDLGKWDGIGIDAHLPGLECNVTLKEERWRTHPSARAALRVMHELAADSGAGSCVGVEHLQFFHFSGP